MSEPEPPRVLGIIVCDLNRTGIGTRSRLAEKIAGKRVIEHVTDRLLKVHGITEVAVLVPAQQMDQVRELVGTMPVRLMELLRRSDITESRVRKGRAWNLNAWRGGAGQWTVFDEEYHPAGVAKACAEAFAGAGADHVFIAPSHGIFLDVEMAAALVHHHLHKNHEMRVTYTPAAPGLCGMVLRADILKEMAEKNVLPGQLLAYDPKAPTFDTLIREACMQVDPALSKIPNRFAVDTQRGWNICTELAQKAFSSVAEMCLAAARDVAPGIKDLSRVHDYPREVEIELTAQRATNPPGSVPENIRNTRAVLDPSHWQSWFARQRELPTTCDDLLVTFAGDGDPLFYGDALKTALLAARHAGALSICVQTDLAAENIDVLLAAIAEGLVDVISATMYGHTAPTYAKVAGADLFGIVIKNMERIAETIRGGGGATGTLLIPRLLKVRETIPEMEPFFDFWMERCGWALFDGPTDRAGSVNFAAVVDMAPPRRKPCRRIWDRLVIRSDGLAVACDQDVEGKLRAGNIESATLHQMWQNLNDLRTAHASGAWGNISPCKSCREWHRP